jgi:hypothetical protein
MGFGRQAYNVLYGTHDGRELVSFDYTYKTQTSDGKTTTTHTHTSRCSPSAWACPCRR